jgi:hypothetical protein
MTKSFKEFLKKRASQSENLKNSNLKPSSIVQTSHSPSAQRRASERWFDEILLGYYRRNATSHFKSESDFFEACAYVVTLTFNASRIFNEKARLGLMNDDHSVEMDNFHRLYTGLCRKLFGSGYSQSSFEAKLPLAIPFIDYEGSRYSSDIPKNPKNVHIHAIWVVHPNEIAKFKKLISGPWFKYRLKDGLHTDRILFDPYVASRAKRGRLIGYVSKTWSKSAKLPNAAEMMRIYPNSNYGGLPYRALHQYQTVSNKLLRLMRAVRTQRRLVEAEEAAKPEPAPSMNLSEFILLQKLGSI